MAGYEHGRAILHTFPSWRWGEREEGRGLQQHNREKAAGEGKGEGLAVIACSHAHTVLARTYTRMHACTQVCTHALLHAHT